MHGSMIVNQMGHMYESKGVMDMTLKLTTRDLNAVKIVLEMEKSTNHPLYPQIVKMLNTMLEMKIQETDVQDTEVTRSILSLSKEFTQFKKHCRG